MDFFSTSATPGTVPSARVERSASGIEHSTVSVERSVLGVQRSLLFLFLLLGLSGCSSLPPVPHAGRPDSGEAEWVPVHGQYAYARDTPGANPVFEVYLTNTGRTARTFTSVTLNGRLLDQPLLAAILPQHIQLDGARAVLPVPRSADPEVLWWDFLPGSELQPGQTTVLKVLFTGVPRPHGTIVARDSDGVETSMRVPRCTPGQPAITAITFARDGGRMFVKTECPGALPAAIWVDGRRAARFATYALPAAPQACIASLDVPAALRPGYPVDVRVRFDNGRERRAMVRMLNRMVLDMPGPHKPTRRLARELQVDSEPLAAPVAVDACCADLRADALGLSAWNVVGIRRQMTRRDPGKLAGFAYCTGATPGSWRIYGHIADAVYAKPYRFGWGHVPENFLDEEQEWIGITRDTAAPLPFLYIPERFRKRGRFLRPAELEATCWTAVLMGAKGIRYHFGLNARGLDDTPALIPSIIAINRRVRELEAVLCQLIPVGGDRQPTGDGGTVSVLSAWAVDHGAIFLVRDATPGALAEDIPPTRLDVVLTLDVPAWCQSDGIVDLATGSVLACNRLPGRSTVTLPEMSGWRLLWVPACGSGQETVDDGFKDVSRGD